MIDFEDSSLAQPAVLVTIVTEAVLKDSLVTLLKNLKVKSYTISPVEGAERRVEQLTAGSESQPEASRETHIETQIEIRTIVSREVSNLLFHVLKEQQRSFAIIVYRQAVEAMLDEVS